MVLNLKKKIDILFLIVFLILCGLFYAILQSTSYTRRSSELVTQTHNFLYSLEKVESAITDIETAHRGFVITGNEAFLDPIAGATNELFGSLAILDTLAKNDTYQKERLNQLKDQVENKLQISNEAIFLRKNETPAVSLDFVASGRGKAAMDSIRMISKAMEREEISKLNDITNENESLIVTQNTFFLVFTAFVLIILFILYLRLRNNTDTMRKLHNKQEELIEELNYQNKQLDDFAHLTSHNIRSPAVNIYTLISLLNESSTIEEYRLIFDKLTKVSKNLNETLNELMEVLHVKKNSRIEKQKLYFEEVFTKVKDSLQGDILVSEAVITSSFKHPVVEYPKTYLESIFHNLLSNSIKYRSSKRKLNIHVETEKIDNRVVLKVSDNGMGIDLEKYGKLVFGLRKTFHRSSNAKGVGLFMTKTQIETLGGQIKVESEVDQGSTFIVTF